MQLAYSARYDQIARLFHWIVAVLVIIALVFGIAMGKMGHGPVHDQIFNLHRAIGMTVLALIVLRLLWRLTHPAPPLPASIGASQRVAAATSHWLLYALVIAQPMIGWLGGSGFGDEINMFGLFKVPPIMHKDEALAKILFGIHGWVGYAIVALVTLHILAALYHLSRRDGVFRRMWW